MHKIIDKKFYLGPKIGTLLNKRWITISELLQLHGELEGIQICQNAPSFNHLLFADDLLVLIKANRVSARSLQNILQLYEVCSGQIVNFDKSSVLFSSNTNAICKNKVLEELHIGAEARTEKILGITSICGSVKDKNF
jgi:hypothetical protein